jgi:hypothetical protein
MLTSSLTSRFLHGIQSLKDANPKQQYSKRICESLHLLKKIAICHTVDPWSMLSIRISLILPSCPPSNSESTSLVGFVMLWIAETLSGTGVSAIFDSKVDLWLGLRTLT